jgi:type I restriction enzyme S subunit
MISLTNVDRSTVSWIELLPIGWQLTRLKWTTNQIKNGIWGDEPKESDDDVICVRVADFDRIAFRVILDKPTLRNVPHSQQHGRLLKSGDLLIEKSGGGELQPVGTVVIYDRHDPAVCSNFIARVEIRDGYDPRFLTYLHAHLYAIRVNTRSIKQTTGIQNLDSQSYFDEFVGIPPWQTQKSIAHFLDLKTAAIDTLIAKKQRLIQLLEEKRTALINQAVTKGLNPNAPMKDSGIPWIGEIPEHWEVKKLKWLCPYIIVGIVVTPAKYYVKFGIPCLRSLNIKPGKIIEENLVYISEESNEILSKSKIFVGDLVCVRTGQPGTTAVVGERFNGINCIDLIIIRKSVRTSSDYISLMMNSEVCRSQYSMGTSGSIQQHFNVETAANLIICNPPLDEQLRIVESCQKIIEKHQILIQKVSDQIEKLQEYRRSLITAAVTGKLEISEVETDV